ncbi:LysM peptidoglycan-binding domain-containing protein [Parahaliea maris]|uniref:LysM peptidoglycan-binding domain-containing protein n=1 Tax=Parahaliea maris TaxID=2716870 RepID=A0A5C8ZWR3_9GAMM|nr:lytic transglycosylase domain-containing protein [Parahaliea maris]TXS91917.1 LysM peptidoglycan-binding domain-containing protein [Parahaliea maris]
MIRGLIAIAALAMTLGTQAGEFPRPVSLEPAVQFWTRVYTQITTNQGYIHDAENLAVIYDTVNLPASGSNAERERQVNNAKLRTASALTSLGKGKRTNLSDTERRVLSTWPQGTSNHTFARAAQNVRFQLGQSDRFREGLVRSGQWKPHIREVLAARGLPRELEVLPHVESSFNPDAWSKVAAAGMWQFMPSTARQFMRVDHVVDERMDPFTATQGAAELLKRNYQITGTWPLALTSYNHGTGGVLRAARTVGTKDIGMLIQEYNGPAFGFASRNFYPSFLAALEVDTHASNYFPDLSVAAPMDYDQVILDAFIPASALAAATGVPIAEFRASNPALRDPIWSGEKYIPQGYAVRIPRSRLGGPLEGYMAAIPGNSRFGHQQPDLTHRIRSGESLWTIARRYGTSVSKLQALNGLRGTSIRAGKTLILPGTVMPEPRLARQTATPVRAAQNHGVYVIRKGDSLWSIARRFNISQQQLVSWNGISTKQYLQPGQKLKVTAAASGQS